MDDAELPGWRRRDGVGRLNDPYCKWSGLVLEILHFIIGTPATSRSNGLKNLATPLLVAEKVNSVSSSFPDAAAVSPRQSAHHLLSECKQSMPCQTCFSQGHRD